jgi:hypothetical protein
MKTKLVTGIGLIVITLITIAGISGCPSAIPTPPDTWVLDDSPARVKISFNNNASSEDLEGFPLLVKLNSGNIDYSNFPNEGASIRFYDQDDETFIPHEIDTWNESGDSLIWVRVPEIKKSSSSDYIWMYYGDSDATEDTQDPDSLWSGYMFVYHFNEATVDILDSGPLGFDAVSESSGSSSIAAELQPGVIGNAVRTQNSGPKRHIDTSFDLWLALWTIEVWVKGDAKPSTSSGQNGIMKFHTIYNVTWDNGGAPCSLQIKDPVKNWKSIYFNGENNDGDVDGGEWNYFAGTFNPSYDPQPQLSAYLNGVLVDSTTDLSGSVANPTVGDSLVIGAESDVSEACPDVLIDEVRLLSKVRSADFINAQYLNMSTDTFTVFSDSEENPTTTTTL